MDNISELKLDVDQIFKREKNVWIYKCFGKR